MNTNRNSPQLNNCSLKPLFQSVEINQNGLRLQIKRIISYINGSLLGVILPSLLRGQLAMSVDIFWLSQLGVGGRVGMLLASAQLIFIDFVIFFLL